MITKKSPPTAVYIVVTEHGQWVPKYRGAGFYHTKWPAIYATHKMQKKSGVDCKVVMFLLENGTVVHDTTTKEK